MAASLAQKLQLQASRQLAVLNPPVGYIAKIKAGLPGIAISSSAKSQCNAVLVFVNDLEQARELFPRAIAAVTRDGLLWVAYPKGGTKTKTDVNRDRLWEATAKTGWRPVRLVAIDETWSAMRFRPADQVGR